MQIDRATTTAPTASKKTPTRVKSPTLQAKDRWQSGFKTAITSLVTHRGGVDLLKDPKALAKLKVGEFRIGRAPANTVYVVGLPGKDDRSVKHLIVRQPQVGPNDRVVGYKFFNLGVVAGGPTV